MVWLAYADSGTLSHQLVLCCCWLHVAQKGGAIKLLSSCLFEGLCHLAYCVGLQAKRWRCPDLQCSARSWHRLWAAPASA